MAAACRTAQIPLRYNFMPLSAVRRTGMGYYFSQNNHLHFTNALEVFLK